MDRRGQRALRVVFLGTPEVAVPTLARLLDLGHDVPLVVTQPDRPAGRSSSPQPPPVKRFALEHGLPVAQPPRVRDAAFLESIAAPRPDVLVVVAYGRILPDPVLAAAPLGAVNVHFSLLPAYRGAAPVQWAIARRESTTGVTTMRIATELDAGDLYLQAPVAIEPRERAPALLARLARAGADLLATTLAGLASASLPPLPQDASRATYAPILTRADGGFDPAWTAAEIDARIRAFDPWPGVWASVSGRRIRLIDALPIPGRSDRPPGTLVEASDDGVIVACAGGTRLELREVQPDGSRGMTAAAALRGRRLALGARLEPPA
ncbi:MAG TPA: methionyl-tRNA formyltransferase [Candidatus Polarisedimenticolaceae bacterium]